MGNVDEPNYVRYFATPLEIRELDGAEGASSLGQMTGHFSVFDHWYQVNSVWEGQFLERVAPGAFAKTIQESRSSMRVLYDHGMDPQIGNKVLGEITDLREDDVGAYFAVRMFNTSYNRDLVPGLRAGAYGSSFRFQVVRDKDEWNYAPSPSEFNPDGLAERTIREARVMEFGPVTFPANPAATSGVRSMTDYFYQRLRVSDPQYVDALQARVQQFRTCPSSPVATGAEQAAPQDPSEPAESHSGGMSPAQRRRRIQRP